MEFQHSRSGRLSSLGGQFKPAACKRDIALYASGVLVVAGKEGRQASDGLIGQGLQGREHGQSGCAAGRKVGLPVRGQVSQLGLDSYRSGW